ncbi:MAG: type 1 glutamine amidotransferase domain-containing protein [Candidatus Nitrosopolaris sp.]
MGSRSEEQTTARDIKGKILVIVTNAGEYEKVGMRTGLWLGELTHFWDFAEEAGFSMDIASPSGGRIPLDPESLVHEVLSELGTEKRYRDRRYMDLLENTKKIANINVEDYDAIYLTGRHGTMFDFRQSKALETLMARFYETGRIVSTVCHGATGLLNVNLSNGEPLIKGKKVTGFSWPEEIIAKRDDAVPFNLEDELKKLGADYSKAGKPFEVHVIEDGRLITGQNPGSARAVAEAVIRRLKTKADSN